MKTTSVGQFIRHFIKVISHCTLSVWTRYICVYVFIICVVCALIFLLRGRQRKSNLEGVKWKSPQGVLFSCRLCVFIHGSRPLTLPYCVFPNVHTELRQHAGPALLTPVARVLGNSRHCACSRLWFTLIKGTIYFLTCHYPNALITELHHCHFD